jgi:hypothetical protein
VTGFAGGGLTVYQTARDTKTAFSGLSTNFTNVILSPTPADSRMAVSVGVRVTLSNAGGVTARPEMVFDLEAITLGGVVTCAFLCDPIVDISKCQRIPSAQLSATIVAGGFRVTVDQSSGADLSAVMVARLVDPEVS